MAVASSGSDTYCAAWEVDAEASVARFWRIWTGDSGCRRRVARSARGSPLRDEAAIEARVRRLLRFAPQLDVPMIVCRAPDVRSARACARRGRASMPLVGTRASDTRVPTRLAPLSPVSHAR